ncbi:hypothetical protein NUH30_01560 [Leptospira sp. 85282-16]|uniref:Lipoprotein n=1 Tax=Leptospira montravelensis TaxID=2484961 RepID=A0ABY2LTT7_9LEPT|nr:MULTISPECIES: hypothetical protein [Leptospira]MCT8332347.1 hypothetical protein [Leptospira sp. 85282-16]TGK83576.1 hypothetical protein EHQ19_03315 [Leptospira montravelensis]TGL05579.1 hypothetical protein EHQ31_02350 [Leptospira montravelensis]
MHILKLTYLVLFITFHFFSCINKNKSPIIPFLPASASAYSYEDIGLPSQPEEYKQVTLPLISNAESEAIENLMKNMDDLGLMTDVSLKQQSVEAWKNIQYSPMSNDEINNKINKESIGLQVNPKVAGTNAELLERESLQATNFFNKVEADFPNFSNEELISIRKKLTTSLIMIRLQMDFGDKTDGVPMEFLKMIQVKTVAHRKKVTEEIINRGVKSL